jgi:hypothetical protein
MPNIIEAVPVPPMFGDVRRQGEFSTWHQANINYSLQGASLMKKKKLSKDCPLFIGHKFFDKIVYKKFI